MILPANIGPLRRRQRGFIINPFRFGIPGADPYFSYVVQLAHFNGTNGSTTFTNSCPRGTTLAASGSGQLSTAQSKFGTASLRTAGSSDGAIESTIQTDYAFSTGAYTVEFWMRCDSVATKNIVFWGDGGFSGIYMMSTGAIKAYMGSTDVITSSAGVITATTWQFVSYSKFGSSPASAYLHVDGVNVGSWTDTSSHANGKLYIGRYNGTTNNFVGYIDDLRVTKGVGRYGSGNYTVPSAAFPDA